MNRLIGKTAIVTGGEDRQIALIEGFIGNRKHQITREPWCIDGQNDYVSASGGNLCYPHGHDWQGKIHHNGGAILADRIEQGFLHIDWGPKATLGVAAQRLNLVAWRQQFIGQIVKEIAIGPRDVESHPVFAGHWVRRQKGRLHMIHIQSPRIG